MPEDHVEKLQAFFNRDVARRATAPLRKGVQIAVVVPDKGPVTLTKEKEGVSVLSREAQRPDITVTATPGAIDSLCGETTQDVGEIGVAILKLMASSDDARKLKAKVHIGPFDLLRNGYLQILPLGGGTVMKFLATKGFTGIGKIKEGISRLRD